MKQPRVFHRLSSLLLAMMLLFSAAWGSAHAIPKTGAKKDVAAHGKSGKAAGSEAQLKATQFEAVVAPAIQLGNAGQSFFLLPAPALIILLLLSIPLLRIFTPPHYYFSYFIHVFGHHIATNAP